MRQPLFGRSWYLLLACALTGCSTFNASSLQRDSQLTRDEQQTQQLIEEANRKARAGDVEGAKKLLARLDERERLKKPVGRASLRGTELEDRDYESDRSVSSDDRRRSDDEPSTDEMIEELVTQGDPASAERRRTVLRAMSPSQIRKMYRDNPVEVSDKPLVASAAPSVAGSSEVPLITPKLTDRVAAHSAPEPRPAPSSIVPSPTSVASAATPPGRLPSNLVVHALASGTPSELGSPEIEQVAGSGVNLLGIQPNDSLPAAPRLNALPGPTSSLPPMSSLPPNGANSLPLINPGPANQGGMPVIVPKGGRMPSPSPDRVNAIQPTQGFAGPNAIEPANRTLTGDLAQPRPTNSLPSGPAGIAAMLDQTSSAPAAGSLNQPSPPGPLQTPPPAGPASPGPSGTPQPFQLPGGQTSQPRAANEPPVDPKKGPRNFVQSAVKEVRNVTERTRLFGSLDSAPAQAPVATASDINSLIASLESQLLSAAPGTSEAEKLDYVRRHVNLRMLYLIAGSSDKALEPIRGIDPQDQEFWQQLLWGISNYFDSQGMPRAADRATQTVNQLRTAAQNLKQQADLELRNVSFCQKIDSYGNYDRSTRDKFPAGLPVLLYAEIENFRSIPAEGDRYMTALKSTIEFYKSRGDGRMLHSIPFDLNQDYCRNRRRDYFLAYEFTMPQQLEPGAYTLVLKVEDALGQKLATSKVNFVVE